MDHQRWPWWCLLGRGMRTSLLRTCKTPESNTFLLSGAFPLFVQLCWFQATPKMKCMGFALFLPWPSEARPSFAELLQTHFSQVPDILRGLRWFWLCLRVSRWRKTSPVGSRYLQWLVGQRASAQDKLGFWIKARVWKGCPWWCGWWE